MHNIWSARFRNGSKPVGYSVTATSAFASCGHSAGYTRGQGSETGQSACWVGLDMSDYPHSPCVARVWQGYTSHICALPRQGLHVDTRMVEQRTRTPTQ